jgi:hypothetical protein
MEALTREPKIWPSFDCVTKSEIGSVFLNLRTVFLSYTKRRFAVDKEPIFFGFFRSDLKQQPLRKTSETKFSFRSNSTSQITVLLFPGIWLSGVWKIVTNVSKEPAASVFRLLYQTTGCHNLRRPLTLLPRSWTQHFNRWSARLHGVASQTTVIFIVTSVRTSNATFLSMFQQMLAASRPALGRTQPRNKWVPGDGREADHSPPFRAVV